MQGARALTDVGGSMAMPRNAGESKAAWVSVNRSPQGLIGGTPLASIPAWILVADRAPLALTPRHTGGVA